MKDFPYTTMPTGWFQVAWSDELPVGAVKPLHYFDTELVVWRGASGDVHALDAHCAHLGAHLGHGGTVADDDIVCPFHNWRWNADGQNVDVPYSERPSQAKRVPCWRARDMWPAVYVWHDAAGEPPAWEPERLPLPLGPDEYLPVWPHTARRWEGVAMQPLLLIENLPDVFHFRYLHGTVRVPSFLDLDVPERGHHVRSHQRFADSRDQLDPAPPWAATGEFHVDVWGLGILFTDLCGLGIAQMANVTPVDRERSDFHFTVFVPRALSDDGEAPTGRAAQHVELQMRLASEDFPIWEHLAYRTKPAFTPEEAGPYRAIRRWAAQFYPHETG